MLQRRSRKVGAGQFFIKDRDLLAPYLDPFYALKENHTLFPRLK